VTALNLIPVGQLDGGHVAYALLGRMRSRLVGRIAIGIMLIIGIFYSYHWLMWGLFVWVLAGTEHAPSRNELTPLTRGRTVLAYGILLLFLSIIVPWPA
jgi:membrane-associated protease RseP (regulator of RpoE activity)